MNFTAYISDNIVTIATKFTEEMSVITPDWSVRFGHGPWRNDYIFHEKNGKKWSFFQTKSVPFWGWSWRSCCKSVQLHPIKLLFWPNRLKISLFNGIQQQYSGVTSWCGNDRVKNLIRAWLFLSKKYLNYNHLAGHDITCALLADLQYHLTHVPIFIKYVDHATFIYSRKATLIWCNKS